VLPLPQQPNSRALGLNDNGDVVGVIGLTQPYFWRHGEANYVALKSLQAGAPEFFGAANGINNQGQIVGEVVDPQQTNTNQAVLWDTQFDNPKPLGTEPGLDYFIGSDANDINEAGTIVGTYYGPGPGRAAALWTAGTNQLMLFADRIDNVSVANAINDAAAPQIVGSFGYGYEYGAEMHAYSYSTGTSQWTDLGTSGVQSVAYDINNWGDIVGASAGRATVWTAFMSTVRLDDPQISPAYSEGWDLIEARGINDAGQIVGWGYLNDIQVPRAWMLTPTHSWISQRIPPAPPWIAQRPIPGPRGEPLPTGARSIGEWLLHRYIIRPLFEGGGWHLDAGGKMKPTAIPHVEPMLKSLNPGLRNVVIAELLGRCSLYLEDQQARRTLEQLARRLLEER